jgi:deoxycytidine triphosphate deaminase
MLINTQLKALGPKLFTPYDAYSIKPYGIELHVGDGFLIDNFLFNGPGAGDLKKFLLPGEMFSIAWRAHDMGAFNENQYRPWKLVPGNTILITTREHLDLPLGVMGQTFPTDVARLNGYGIGTQLVPHGHYGPVTIAVTNLLKRTDLPIYPGLPIAYLTLNVLDALPEAEALALPERVEVEHIIAIGEYSALL